MLKKNFELLEIKLILNFDYWKLVALILSSDKSFLMCSVIKKRQKIDFNQVLGKTWKREKGAERLERVLL